VAKTAIEAVGLNKWFGEGDAKTHAVKDVNFDAHFGEILYVVGPSGSGKTTMLSMISGILRPNSGSVKIEGTEIWGLSNDALAEFRLHKIGFVFQDYHLFPRLTTAENVAIPLILQKRDWDEALKEAVVDLEIVGLKDRTQLPPVKLSGGIGAATNSVSSLFPSNGRAWNVGAQASAPLFEGGTMWFKRKAAIDEYDQAMALYRQTVLSAFEQVADTLRALDHDAAALLAQDQALSAAAEALHLVHVNYDAGIATYLDVLLADAQYHQAKIADLQAIAVRYQDTVALFAALGGGWWNVQ
jgi:ABC-type transport system involved in cytochrome c biogenesis ATPase subunit